MPTDLDQLAQDTDHQDRWGTPPTGNDLQDLAGQQQMTHQSDRPNPAQPYLDWLSGAARRTFVDPLQTAGFLPGDQDWGRPAVEGMMNFNQSGLTGVAPSLRNVMPGAANTLGDLVQSPSARSVFSSANLGGLPLAQAIVPRFNSPEALTYYGQKIGMPENQFASRLWGGLHDPTMSITHYNDVAGKRLVISGRIADKHQPVGVMTRTIYPEEGRAYHDDMNINADMQGSGYSKRILGSQFSLYPELGINQVRITAVGEGASQWPKSGFLPYKQAWPSVKNVISENYNEMKSLGVRFTEQEKYYIEQALRSGNREDMWLITDLNRKYRPFDDPHWQHGDPLTSHGRELTKGSFWSGDFNFTNKAQVDRANDYLKDYLGKLY